MQSQQQYSFWVRFASSAAVIAALTMIIIKADAWSSTDSASVLASLADSIFDVSASIINFFVVRYALIPADDDHRFGHGKAESLAGLIQAAFLTGSAILLVIHSLGRLNRPIEVQNIAITLVLVIIQTLALKRAKSIAIKADSLHYKGDLLMNLGVIAALYLTQAGYLQVDAWIAILIACYLIYGAYEVGYESVQSLMDRELSSDEQSLISKTTMSVDQVLGLHDIRTRRSGGTVFIQLHLELDDHLNLLTAHKISDKVEHALLIEFPNADVLIHLDPVSVVTKHKENIKYNDGDSTQSSE